MMLRSDSSSLIPRENVRFLGEPLLSSVTECIFYVLYRVRLYVRDTSELRDEAFVRDAADVDAQARIDGKPRGPNGDERASPTRSKIRATLKTRTRMRHRRAINIMEANYIHI